MINMEKKEEHYLLTAIGTNPRETKYIFQGKEVCGSFSSTALLKGLDDKPEKIFLLLTEGTKGDPYDRFKEEVDIEITEIIIPNGINDEEVQKILRNILDAIPENSRLTMDVSGGLRHFPFLFFASALYLHSFKNVNIEGIYYGMLEVTDEKGRGQFVDLKVVMEMVRWFHAIKEFTDEKRSNLLARMLSETMNMDKDVLDIHAISTLKNLTTQIQRFDEYYGAGLSLGIGDSSKSLINQLSQKEEKIKTLQDGPIPIVDELMTHVADSMGGFKLPDINTKGRWKDKYLLDIHEIQRQSRIIDSYFETGHYVNAIRLMREWMVSRCLLSHQGSGCKWLDRKVRLPIERQLGSIKWQSENKILIDEKKDLATIWESITRFRNEIAHSGMTEESIDIKDHLEKVEKLWIRMKEMVDSDKFWDPYVKRGKGKLLITPLGLSKGLLYSALKLIRPDRCLIVTSEKAKETIEEIIIKADFSGELCEPIVLKDPYTGFGEIKNILGSMIPDRADNLLDAEEIIVNLTGGTTTMQVLVEEIYKLSERMGKHPKKVVIFDQRTMIEQNEDPFVEGKLINLKDIL